jgi:hypothetical protein
MALVMPQSRRNALVNRLFPPRALTIGLPIWSGIGFLAMVVLLMRLPFDGKDWLLGLCGILVWNGITAAIMAKWRSDPGLWMLGALFLVFQIAGLCVSEFALLRDTVRFWRPRPDDAEQALVFAAVMLLSSMMSIWLVLGTSIWNWRGIKAPSRPPKWTPPFRAPPNSGPPPSPGPPRGGGGRGDLPPDPPSEFTGSPVPQPKAPPGLSTSAAVPLPNPEREQQRPS